MTVTETAIEEIDTFMQKLSELAQSHTLLFGVLLFGFLILLILLCRRRFPRQQNIVTSKPNEQEKHIHIHIGDE